MNSHRLAVGYSQLGNSAYQASLWRPNANAYPFDLSLPVPGAAFATGVNDGGIVVGYTGANFAERAFVWDPIHGASTLPYPSVPGVLSTEVFAYQINSNGQIVGEEYLQTPAGPVNVPLVWVNGSNSGPIVLPNPFPQKFIGAKAISDFGMVGGQLDSQAALWNLNLGNAYKILGTFQGDSARTKPSSGIRHMVSST